MNEQKLLRLKKQIQEDKELLQRLEGQKTSIMEQLLDQFECSSIEQAEKLQITLKKQISELDIQIEEKEGKLEQYEI